jgi:hypothetical protein
MKIRMNKRRILSRLAHNKQYFWFVTAALSGSDKRRIFRERIQATVDKAFPDLKGIPCPSWI